MPPHTPISTLLTPLLRSFRSLNISSSAPTTLSKSSSPSASAALLRSNGASNGTPSSTKTRQFSTTSALLKKKGRGRPKTITDQRVALIRYHMQHPLTPRPLRFSRLRALRHWTIHRAWMLFRRGKLQREENELLRMHQSMHSACEALRNLDGPGTKDAGRLYRIAMEKKGVFQHGGVPIEYARLQVDTPAKEAWNHGWTR